MNGFALDSNIISFHLKGNTTDRRNVGLELDVKTKIYIPPFAYYEVKRGLLDAKATTQLRLFDKLLKDCRLGDATNAVFEAAVDIHVALKSKGRICDDMDILIAAFCQTYGLTLVTNNTRHFENIAGLGAGRLVGGGRGIKSRLWSLFLPVNGVLCEGLLNSKKARPVAASPSLFGGKGQREEPHAEARRGTRGGRLRQRQQRGGGGVAVVGRGGFVLLALAR